METVGSVAIAVCDSGTGVGSGVLIEAGDSMVDGGVVTLAGGAGVTGGGLDLIGGDSSGAAAEGEVSVLGVL